jgi:UDP-N-acetylglucosamine--N-acetylmuramyl-(pentapeptide) pyrophosphoryl-undecaprenol N-acetylglucosamine transferase
MRIIVSAGGTGGHIYPALAIINKFKEKEHSLQVLYIGTHNRMEKDLIPKENIRYEELEIYGFSKTKWIRNIRNIFLIKKAEKKIEQIIAKFKPDVVIGVGGYVTYPVIKVAKRMGIKTFIHEQNSVPGKTNRFLAKDTDLVGVSFNNSKDYFAKAKKVIYSGNPCGDSALTEKSISVSKFGVTPGKKVVLIVGGSLGSMTLNQRFKSFLSLVDTEPYEFIYVTGKNYYEDFIKDMKYPKNVHIVDYIDHLSGLMQNVDLIISRAGASTISEILALRLPSILIPSPYVANNHQYYNALDLSNMKVSVLIEEKNLKPERLIVALHEVMDVKYNDMKKELEKITFKSSSDIIYDEIKRILEQ